MSGRKLDDGLNKAIMGLLSAAVVQGQAKPLMRPGQICPAIHGDSGLDFLEGGSMQATLLLSCPLIYS